MDAQAKQDFGLETGEGAAQAGALPAQSLAAEIDREFSEELRREEGVVESLLFMMGRSVSVEEMATALNTGPEPAMAAAERLLSRYEAAQGGILIQRLEDRYQMQTNPQHFDAMIRLVKKPQKPVLTDVLVETLAIIAYRQPVTKAEIERIRGVNSDHAVNRLVEYGLAREAGRLNAPGRPVLFATTEEFLRHFGLSSLRELPDLQADVAAAIESEAEAEIAEILGLPAEELEGKAEGAAENENAAESGDGEENESGENAGHAGKQEEKAEEAGGDPAAGDTGDRTEEDGIAQAEGVPEGDGLEAGEGADAGEGDVPVEDPVGDEDPAEAESRGAEKKNGAECGAAIEDTPEPGVSVGAEGEQGA